MYMRRSSARGDAATTVAVVFAHQAPGVAYGTFLSVVWAGACISFVFLLLRLISRFRGPRRLFWDDGFAVFGWLLVLASAALWQWIARDMYYVLDISAGLATPGVDFWVRMIRFARVQFVVELFFYTTLVAIKLSFLFFFKRLGKRVRGQQYIWWTVLFFALASYVVSLGDNQYVCEFGSAETLESYCNSTSATNFTVAVLNANCALDVFSDFLIMLIPISILWNVRVPLRKKMAFMGLFSLTIITIVVAIVRAVNITSTRQGTGQEDTTFLWLWSAVQAPLAVIVACISSFPQLFSGQGAAKPKPVWTPTDTYYQRLKTRMKATSKRDNTLYDLPTVVSIPEQSLPTFDSSRSLGRDQYALSYDSLELEPQEPEEIQHTCMHPQHAEKTVLMDVPKYHGPAVVDSGRHPDTCANSSPPYGYRNPVPQRYSYDGNVMQEPAPVHHYVYFPRTQQSGQSTGIIES